ncbi:hypothetical protein YC2023_020535 [Brassica napus]
MKWDVMSWTPDGYVAIVTMFNFQKYRHRRKSYGVWSEHKQPNKVNSNVFSTISDCSKYKGTLHAHTNSSLLRELQLAAFLCLLSTMRPLLDVQLALADAKTTKQGLVPVLSDHKVLNFVSSGSVFNHKVSNFVSSDSVFSHKVFCFQSQSLKLCFFCPDTPHLACVVSPPTKKGTVLPPLVQCTRHLCPIRVHWHVKQNYKSRVLASEDHNHKLQLPFKLLAVEHGSSTSEPRQHHSDLQLQLQVSHSLRWTK